MTGAHWLILAAFAGFAVLVVLLRWRWPRVWRREEVDEIWRRAGVRSGDIRRWVDEPGDPTHEQIDQALDVVAEDEPDPWQVEGWRSWLRGKSCADETYCPDVIARELARKSGPLWPEPDRSDLDIATEVDRAKADHLNAAMAAVDHPYTHLTPEEVADCPTCSPSGLPRHIEGGDEHA